MKYVTKHKFRLAFAIFLMIFCMLLNLLIPFLTMKLVDEGILLLDSTMVLYCSIGIIMVALTAAVLGYLRNYLFVTIGGRVHQDLKNEIFEHVQTLDTGYFDSTSTGELLSRVDSDVENVWVSIDHGLKMVMEYAISFIGTSIILLWINWQLAVVLLVILLPVGLLTIGLRKRLGEDYGVISDHVASLNTRAQQNIAGVRVVKAFAREKHEVINFLRMNNGYFELNMNLARTYRTYYPLIEFLTNMSLVAMIIFGGYFILEGVMTMGELVAFSGYIWNLIFPMRSIGWLTDMLSKNLASAKKIFKILDYKTKIENKPDAVVVDEMSGMVEFKNVQFKYNDASALTDINVSVQAGSKVAIMGATGAGKSTFLSLISRMYDAEEGSVHIDGVDVRDYDLKTLRMNISLVAQETFLFSDTLENNIKLGNPYATEEEMREACRTACALEFIDHLDEGLQTEIGERGMGLSGGQKQRVAIARALLKKAPILILDDSTSALDMETEYELLKNLNERDQVCTTFLVAHRISAVMNADKIIFMEDRKIVETGTHEELIERKGKYFAVYQEQFKGLDTEEGGV